jgi:FKBP-type peptidyl-prolyl cis-trans isomerase SlyD
MLVEKNKVVSFRYVMKNSKGDILENTLSGAPASYLHGSAGIEPSLQSQLEGMKRGDKKNVFLPANSGLVSEDFIFEIIVDDVRAASGAEIALGYPVQLPVSRCEEDCDCYSENKNTIR